jgi:hypothetical protein
MAWCLYLHLLTSARGSEGPGGKQTDSRASGVGAIQLWRKEQTRTMKGPYPGTPYTMGTKKPILPEGVPTRWVLGYEEANTALGGVRSMIRSARHNHTTRGTHACQCRGGVTC